jgi:hypothetical protein
VDPGECHRKVSHPGSEKESMERHSLIDEKRKVGEI